MLKAVYSSKFLGIASSNVGQTSFGIALLPSHSDSFVVEATEGRVSISATGETFPFSRKINIRAVGGDRFQFEDLRSFAESRVVEGSSVSFGFDAKNHVGSKVIQTGNVYYVTAVDSTSSPPFFSVGCIRGARSLSNVTYQALQPISQTAYFHTIQDGCPVSFDGSGYDSTKVANFDVENADHRARAEVLPAESVVYAQNVTITTSSIGFHVSSRPLQTHRLMHVTKFRAADTRVRLHSATRLLHMTESNCIVRADASPPCLLRALPPRADMLAGVTLEMYANLFAGTADVDAQLLFALSTFESACRFFDVSCYGTRSEFQKLMLQKAKDFMEKNCTMKSVERDLGSLELVEYASSRLLQLNSMLKSNAIEERYLGARRSVLNRIQMAWNVLNLYGATVLCDTDSIIDESSVHQSCSSCCISMDNSAFALVRNGFLVLGNVATGECISLHVDSFTESKPYAKADADLSLYAGRCGMRPCVVDATVADGCLCLLILFSVSASGTHSSFIHARLFKVEGFSFKSVSTEHSNELVEVNAMPLLLVGSCFPFIVSVPKFVLTSSRASDLLHVFAIQRDRHRPQLYRISLSQNTAHMCELHFDCPACAGIEWGSFEYLSSAIVQRPSRPQDLWVLFRIKASVSMKKQAKLWRFGLQSVDSTSRSTAADGRERLGEVQSSCMDSMETTSLASALVDEVCLDIPVEVHQGPIDLWQVHLTNHGLGIGVSTPDGHIYHVIKTNEVSFQTQKIETPFFTGDRSLLQATFVPWKQVRTAHVDSKCSLDVNSCFSLKQQDELIKRAHSFVPHFLAVQLGSEWMSRRNQNCIGIVPFCPAKNLTRHLLLGMQGEATNSEPVRTASSQQISVSGDTSGFGNQVLRVEALRAYRDLLIQMKRDQLERSNSSQVDHKLGIRHIADGKL